jgi:hypothetical protein
MGARDVRRLAALAAHAALLAACASPAYAPCPVELPGELPADAFARCRDVLLHRYGDLAVIDRNAFLLQTEWAPVQDPPGERRASVFRDEKSGGLAVVVELRWLRAPLFGMPSWSEPRGDDAAERELAADLRAEFAPSPAAGN